MADSDERQDGGGAKGAAPEGPQGGGGIPLDPNDVALGLVHMYASSHLDKSDGPTGFEVYVVWQCCILGNRKWLISTSLPDGMYYEVTYNEAEGEYYLDAYKKFENVCIPVEALYA